MKKLFMGLMTVFGSFALLSQTNLINNPGLEIVSSNVTGHDQLSKATGWSKSCTADPIATPDLFDRFSSDCAYDIPSNKWSDNKETRVAGTNRYAGFSSSEQITGSLSGPLTLAGKYLVSFYASKVDGYHLGCLSTPDASAPSNFSVNVSLINSANCPTKKLVWTSPTSSTTSWTKFSGTFSLSPTDAAAGYNKIEFETTGEVIFFDDANLELDCEVNEDLYNAFKVLRIEKENYTSGTTNEKACREIYAGNDVGHPGPNGNVTVSGSANVEYKAGQRIFLKEGFSATPNSSGNFHAFIDPSCICDPYDDPIVALGDDLEFCQLQNGTLRSLSASSSLGAICSGGAGAGGTDVWTVVTSTLTPPSAALNWLSNPNTCNPSIVAPSPPLAKFDVESATFRLTVTTPNGKSVSDEIEVTIYGHACDDHNRLKDPNLFEISDTDKRLSIYPNPTNGSLNLELGNRNSGIIRVYNYTGQIVRTIRIAENTSKMEFDLNNQSKGIYFLEIAQGEVITVEKIVKN